MDQFPREVSVIGHRLLEEVHKPHEIFLHENAGQKLTFQGVRSVNYFYMSIYVNDEFLGVFFSIKTSPVMKV